MSTRRRAKARILLRGPSWGGKTTSALLMAYGMTDDGKGGHSFKRIAGIDTENGRMEVKAGMEFNGVKVDPFLVTSISEPYTVEKYVMALAVAEKLPIDVIIIDSASHEWAGPGGLLERKDSIDLTSNNRNGASAWNVITPLHNRFISAILSSPKHVIVTLRTKSGISMVEGEDSKTKVRRVALDSIMRDCFEFEFSWAFSMIDGIAIAEKDDSCLFPKDKGFVPGPETGEAIIAWLNQGVDEEPPKTALNYDCKAVLCDCGSRATLEATDDVVGKKVGIYRCLAENRHFRRAL